MLAWGSHRLDMVLERLGQSLIARRAGIQNDMRFNHVSSIPFRSASHAAFADGFMGQVRCGNLDARDVAPG